MELVDVTVYYLEMLSPSCRVIQAPREGLNVVHVRTPAVEYYRDLYNAVGRAMRNAPGKTTGDILVPLYAEQAAGEALDAAVARAEFDEVWAVLQALQEQDEVLDDLIHPAAGRPSVGSRKVSTTRGSANGGRQPPG